MNINFKKLKITFNSPVILTFSFICFLVMILGNLTHGASTRNFFSVYRSSLTDPLTYIRFFGHILGHANWTHFFGNMLMILVLGPLLEEKYGSQKMISIIVITALITGFVNYIFFPNTMLLGASGVVFALILLSSITGIRDGEIPLTFLLVAVIYLGQQVYDGIFIKDNISNMTHLLGGITGSAFGFSYLKNKD